MQTSIVTDGFRSLRDGEAVEFVSERGDDGRLRAVQVTGPEGANPEVPPLLNAPTNSCLPRPVI